MINKRIIKSALFAIGAMTAAFATVSMAQDNPYEPVPGEWVKLPEGRHMGSSSAVYYAGEGKMWVVERCGADANCLDTPDIDPIILVDRDGEILKMFGKNMFVWPHGITIDNEGNIWVADSEGDEKRGVGHQVHKFSPDGEPLMSLGKKGVSGKEKYVFHRPTDVAVAANGDIFVADGHGKAGNNRVVKYDTNGKYIMEFGKIGSNRGEFREPHSLAINSKGHLFVADRYNARVQIFDLEGNHIDNWTQFGRPSGLYIDANDILYSADSSSNTGYQRNAGWQRGIRIGSSITGWVTSFIPDPNVGYAPNWSSVAEGVTADEEGNVYGAEVAQERIVKYIPKTYSGPPEPKK